MSRFAERAESRFGKYLFCYFTGNEPERERICFAVSKDGYSFTPLNASESVIVQKTGTGCMRDPFILRAKDSGFYIVATDMKSSLGWDSNHGIVTWKSDNLTDWYDETAVDFHMFKESESADKIWAPQAIYDENEKRYLVYYSLHNKNSGEALAICYSYTRDFKKFSPPKKLFSPESGKDAIDADIVFARGKYYMCYKDECEKTICQVESDNLKGPYTAPPTPVACTDRHVEGNCTYKINGTDTYVMIMDMYCDNRYFMQQTDDFVTYLPVKDSDYSLDFTPRHGSVISITDEEYDRLVSKFGF